MGWLQASSLTKNLPEWCTQSKLCLHLRVYSHTCVDALTMSPPASRPSIASVSLHTEPYIDSRGLLFGTVITL